jgi:hypothetical protein
MRLEIKEGGDGVLCWNKLAIGAYVEEVNENEARLARDNPDLSVIPGRIMCYGCEVMEYDYGIKCTAHLTRTRYAVKGEIEPRPEDAADAARSLSEIPGLQTRAPETVHAAAPQYEAAAAATAIPQGRQPGRRGLFGRSR